MKRKMMSVIGNKQDFRIGKTEKEKEEAREKVKQRKIERLKLKKELGF